MAERISALLLWFPLGLSIFVVMVSVTLLLFVRRRTLRQAGREMKVQTPELLAAGKFLFLVMCGVGGLISFIGLMENEGLFVAEPVVYLLRAAFVASLAWLVSLFAQSIARDLQAAGLMEPKSADRVFFKMMIGVVIVLAVYSRGMVLGGLHRLDRGQPVDVSAAVVSTGHRAKYGSWIDVQIEGRKNAVELMPRTIYSIHGDDYSCMLARVQKDDTLRLLGRVSFLGFAVDEMKPANERLVEACKVGP